MADKTLFGIDRATYSAWGKLPPQPPLTRDAFIKALVDLTARAAPPDYVPIFEGGRIVGWRLYSHD